MPRKNLTADQQMTLANGMRTAAAKYRECADAMRAERARRVTHRPNGALELSGRLSYCEQLAETFDQQAIEASQLADIIENATDVAIVE